MDAREDEFDVGALGAWTMPRGSARMALLRVSYVLLCAVAGVDIMLDIMIAEYMYTAKSPVVCISRCQTASSKAEAARAGCWRGHELHLHHLLSHPRVYQATRCHQRTPTATTAHADNNLWMLCQQSHGTLADHARTECLIRQTSDQLAPVSELVNLVLYKTALT